MTKKIRIENADTAMNKILNALEALCRACPDVNGIGVDIIDLAGNAHFAIKCTTEAKVHELAGERGLEVKRHVRDGHTWLAAYGATTIYGPHSKHVAAEIDESAVDAAVKKASEAIEP